MTIAEKSILIELRPILPIAGRAVLFSIPEKQIPGAIFEIKEFINDRGTVHFVLIDYLNHGNLEKTLIKYWDSRIGDCSFRIEGALAAVLIAFAVSVAANIAYSLGRGAIPGVRDWLKNSELIASLSKSQGRNREDTITLFNLLLFRNYLYATPGTDDRKVFYEIIKFLKAGGSLRAYIEKHSNDSVKTLSGLDDVQIAAKGLMLPVSSPEPAKPTRWDKILKGLPLSDRACFGAIVNCHPNALLRIDEIKRLIRMPVQLRTLAQSQSWQFETIGRGRSPKVVFLDDRDFTGVFQHLTLVELSEIAGFVTASGGMTSHTGVTSRSMGRAAICVPSIFSMITEYKFAAISADALLLNRTFPTFALDVIEPLLAYQASRRLISD